MTKLLIVEARYYTTLSDMLLAGAQEAIVAAGYDHEVISVPGALEIPAAIAFADQAGGASDADQYYAGYVALGVVIRGETHHFDIVANESARAIMALTLDGLAIGNGILTVENEAQAHIRADKTDKNKGGKAAQAALAMIGLQQHFAV